jgi:hypothetical protein
MEMHSRIRNLWSYSLLIYHVLYNCATTAEILQQKNRVEHINMNNTNNEKQLNRNKTISMLNSSKKNEMMDFLTLLEIVCYSQKLVRLNRMEVNA